MPYNTVDRGTIKKMVREFYAIILKDDVLGPYFIKALGDDLKNGKWHEHFNTLDNFWLMMMTGERGYMGDPFPSHAFIGELYPETFERWLKLFNEVVHKLFVPEIAEKFYKKAEILAKQFMDNLDINGED
ncbi:group III truncated hemoglobin [Candidatus Sulfurimonas marisnigri]|uniref:Group III truncated hemoglobin n=1 Tax=Candidatus Sulfurimonas marisnigri TaxID=2740405 RepID=A0A7S7RQD9_9BACT|nr:group III truncated hemoglobin [Candidatus Sulfurimonas marisnigri]QOY55347.1 group III truncated hemoglobin [Candidatus Sulfurimonas marisnigri]